MIMADFLTLFFSLQNSASASDKLGRGCKVLRQGGGAIGLPVRGLELGGGSRAPILPHFPTFPTHTGPAPGKLLLQQLTRPYWCGLVMITMVVVLLVIVVMLSRMTMVVVMLVMMTMEMVMLFMVVMEMAMLVMVLMPEF